MLAKWSERYHSFSPSHWASAALIALFVGALALTSCGSAETTDDEVTTPVQAAPATGAAEAPAVASDSPSQALSGVVIQQYAGNGQSIFSGDGGPAEDSGIRAPAGLAVDAAGNLYISTDNRIRRVDAETGTITTLAGTGSPGYGGDGGPATEAKLKAPEGIAIDLDGNVLIADRDNGRIRRLDISTGIMTTVAGGGIPKIKGGIFQSGDGEAATDAWFKEPLDVDVDDEGNFYFVAGGFVRKVDTEGIISTIAGTGLKGLSGDGGPGYEAMLAEPQGVAVDSQGNVYVADRENQRIRMIDAATGVISTVVGIGKHGSFETADKDGRHRSVQPEGIGAEGDGGPATSAMLAFPEEIDIFDGRLFIADTVNDSVRMVDLATGIITKLADGGAVRGEAMITGFRGSGDLEVTFEHFGPPFDVVATNDNTVFLADLKGHRVARIQFP